VAGIKLGAHILDTCGSPAFALNQSLNFVRELMGELDTTSYKCKIVGGWFTYACAFAGSDGKTPRVHDKLLTFRHVISVCTSHDKGLMG
jgi:hypothetical protein